MVNLQDFISCTFQAQINMVGDLGKFVNRQEGQEQMITLFRIENFFVEIFFSFRQLRVTHLHAYDHTTLPKHYYEDGLIDPEPEEEQNSSNLPLPNKASSTEEAFSFITTPDGPGETPFNINRTTAPRE